MSIERCIAEAVAEGRLSKGEAEDYLRQVRELEAKLGETLAPESAMAEARMRTAEKKAAEAKANKADLEKDIVVRQAALAKAQAHPDGFAAGTLALIDRDLRDKVGGSVTGRSKAIYGELQSLWADGLAGLRSRYAGLVSKRASAANFVREMFGEGTADQVAKTAAKGWTEASDHGLLLARNAGLRIGNPREFYIPQQIHNPVELRRAGKEAWMQAMRDMWGEGRLKVYDHESGIEGAQVSPRRFDEIVGTAYDRIITDGLSDIEPGRGGAPGRKIGNRFREPRAFEFANAEAWLDYNRRFGYGDDAILGILDSHQSSVAKTIASVEVLGSNPDLTVRWLQDQVRAEEATRGRPGIASVIFQESAEMIGYVWDDLTGRTNYVPPQKAWLANLFQGARGFAVAAKGGSMVLSSTGDFATMRNAAAWNGWSALSTMREYAKQLGSEADRVKAVRLGIGAHGWANAALAGSRYNGDIVGRDIGSRFATAVVRAQGLAAHTDALRFAAGTEFLGHLADNRALSLADLEAPLRRSFERYGITEADWNAIRSAPVLDIGGATYMDHRAIAGAGNREAAVKMLEMVQTEVDAFAVPMPGHRERAALLRGTNAGTFWGEVIRNTVMFKSFPVTMMATHLARGYMAQGAIALLPGAYTGNLLIGTTAMGLLAIWAKDIVAGREPREINATTVGQAFAQGGGLGIAGDFLASGLSRTGNSAVATLGGPLAGTAEDLLRLSSRQARRVYEGDDTRFAGEAIRFLKQNSPGSSLWYGRLALDRLAWDQLQMLVDDQYSGSFRRMEQRARDDMSTQFWWRPGRTAPEALQ